MKRVLTISDCGRYMISTREGTWTRKEHVDYLQHLHEIQSTGKRLGIYQYIVDLTEAQTDLSPVDVFELLNYDIPENTDIWSFTRIALLVAPNDNSFDFLEVVARNASYKLRLFRDRVEAIRFVSGHAVTPAPF